ncbi:MAG TPA: alpha/beta hydrolase [Solirubrobacteraceae bacterium]|nr:alpha/beta hydrolase [Solirubrobacteraceae bacterium]
MSAEATVSAPPKAPIWGELRYSAELARLLADDQLWRRRPADAQPVMLIPGFMAGDASLAVLRGWLRRRGHPVAMSGLLANVDCAERILARLEKQLLTLAEETSRPVVLIGQSRGGALARALAVREPERVAGLVMLGSPVRDALAVSRPVLRTVRWMARLGDLRVPGLFSTACRDGVCCAVFREDLVAPLAPGISVVSIHSRSDAIVDWRACLEPHGEQVEIDSSHCGMSVHPGVYRVLDRVLSAESPAR